MDRLELWTEQDLNQLIQQGREENIELEFKRAAALQNMDSKKAEIGKDISAFANSAGGILIYGIEEDTKAPHQAVALSPVDPSVASKDWLENVIDSRIRPRIQGVRINPVELKGSHPGKYVYVVVIPESFTAHQASDHRYYKRFNFKAAPMEDYEVRQTMARASRPSYEVVLAVHSMPSEGKDFFGLHCTLQNRSEIVGRDVSVVLLTPQHLVVPHDDYIEEIDGATCARMAGQFIVSSFSGIANVIDSLPPLNPHGVRFHEKLKLPTQGNILGEVKVTVRVFDQFGLSLTSKFVLPPFAYQAVLVDEEHASKTSRTYASIFRRP